MLMFLYVSKFARTILLLSLRAMQNYHTVRTAVWNMHSLEASSMLKHHYNIGV